MESKLPIALLKMVTSGSVTVSENGNNSLEFIADGDEKHIHIFDLPVDVPGAQTFFQKLNHAKKFAKSLKENNITITISDHNNEILKIGKEAKPKLSRLITSSAVQIIDLRNLRHLDKRLRS